MITIWSVKTTEQRNHAPRITRLNTKFPYSSMPTYEGDPRSANPTRPICAHPTHILSHASHTITHLTSQVPALLTFHRNSTGCDAAILSGKHVPLASYVSIGCSPLTFFYFQHPPPHSTSITLLELASYFCPLRKRLHYPLHPLRGRGVIISQLTLDRRSRSYS